jgi:YidC/Oxa1 family membrane protein insertase
MDRRTLIAVALCLVVFLAYPFILKLLGLDQYLRPPVPERLPADSARVVARDTAGSATPEMRMAGSDSADVPFAAAGGSAAGRVITVETPLYRAWFNTRGARLLDVELKHYRVAHRPTREPGGPRLQRAQVLPERERVRLAGQPAFGLDLGSGQDLRHLDDVTFEPAESLDASGAVRTISFRARDPGGALIRQTYRLRPDDHAMDLEVEIRNVPAASRLGDYSLTVRSWPLFHENDPLDEERSLKATSLVGTNLHREAPGGLKRAPKVFEGNAAWAAVQTRYFIGVVAVAEGSAKAAVAAAQSRPLTEEERARLGTQARVAQDRVTNTLVVSLPGESDPTDRFLVYFGPNEYFRLSRLEHGLDRLVDLGWSWIVPFSKLLLRLLVWLEALFHNYGLAIIVLATLVRMLLHPLSMMSIKSMRSMQAVQPEIERIREKYKKDPQAMNAAMMALYKQHKINPAGGCLPLLVQMPIFIALYSVLFNAIELRQAPFVGWIDDLSAPDELFRMGPLPIRVLPLIMTLTGLLQQKLTPTDPRQAVSMYLMNVLMLVFFYNLPSGLVLYWTVMNLLTALQQWIGLREHGQVTTVAGGPKVAAPAGTK